MIWRVLAEDMKERGMSFNQQAIELEKSLSTYFRWLDGSSPRFDEGLEVLILHSMVCGAQVTRERIGDDWITKIRLIQSTS